MRLFHTSDWHIGRTFHGHATLEALREVLLGMARVVADEAVDVVLVAGDVFDSATPAAAHYELLTEALGALRAAGAAVVLTSGNHDSATRLGFQSEFARLGGVHVITRPEHASTPVTLTDEAGEVHVYGIPYLEPVLVRHRHPGLELRTHEQVLAHAMDAIRADIADRGGRSIVMAHCFAVAVAGTGGAPDGDGGQTAGLERDISAGGLDLVPAAVFDGPDYVALGHLHGRVTLTDRVRYSGAPLHYSFAEAGKPRGGWLVDLDEAGLSAARWVDLPVPRPLARLTGTLDELLGDPGLSAHEQHWVGAVLTDRMRPIDAMRRLRERFPRCASVEHRPAVIAEPTTAGYRERVRSRDDAQVIAGFLEHVRNGVGPTPHELKLIAEIIAAEGAVA